jgi:hypothetical protein
MLTWSLYMAAAESTNTTVAIAMIVTTTVTYVVVFASATNATAASVVLLAFANSAASMKFLADATPTGLNDGGFLSAVHPSMFSQRNGTSDFHCRGNQTFAVEICLLVGFMPNLYALCEFLFQKSWTAR